MKNMVILVDTNVILGYYQEREGHFEYAQRLFQYGTTKVLKGYVAFHSMSIIWYALRKYPYQDRRTVLREIAKMLTVTAAPHSSVWDAILNEDFPDFEDCLQEKCALEVGADYIVTRNVKDFSASKIPAVTPAELLEIIHSS